MKDRRAPLILVVDVADASRLVLSDVLRRSGFDVEQASTGAEALSHISARPDLIVLVANLPDLSALGRPLAELIIPRRLRATHREGLARYLAAGSGRVVGHRIEMLAMRADGSEFPVELTVSVHASERGRTFVGFVRDISDAKRAEA